MKRAVAALFGVWLICLLCPVAFAATVTIAVRTESTVAGPWLTLGDIAAVSGEVPERVKELQELKLGDAPDPGTTVFMTPASLEPKLAANRIDFSGISWNVPGQFKITTLSQPVSGRKVADLAREYLTRTAQDSTISLLDLPADIQAPVGALELVPELFGAIRFSGPTTVNIAVRTAGRTFMKIPVRFEVRRYLDVVVTARQSERRRYSVGTVPAAGTAGRGKNAGRLSDGSGKSPRFTGASGITPWQCGFGT